MENLENTHTSALLELAAVYLKINKKMKKH